MTDKAETSLPGGPIRRRSRRQDWPHPDWENAADEELLDRRICDLGVRIEQSPLEDSVRQLYSEVESRGLTFKPRCYLTLEWLCPDRVPVIGIPFWLAHPRLIELEKKMMLEAEGADPAERMRLLRHEAGHAYNYAYRFYRRTRWRELFGPISADYNPDEYPMRPYSRKYVIHLKDNYAQAHPDEDFAETFAVWLTPGLDWRRKYAGWPALKKLEYVDRLMKETAGKPPVVTGGELLRPASHVRATLRTYYNRKRKEFRDLFPEVYDRILNSIFSTHAPEGAMRASDFIRKYRRELINTVARLALVRKYLVNEVLARLSARARKLQLYQHEGTEHTLLRLGVVVTSLVLEERYVLTRSSASRK